MAEILIENIESIITGFDLKKKWLNPFKTEKNKAIINSLINKTIAISSGKGGVGKTTTASNLAVYFSRKGLRTGLIDLDPLSDTTSLLDVEDSESIKFYEAKNNKEFSSNIINVFENLDILFPASKLKKENSYQIYESIYKKFSSKIDSSYDILILDLPAGNRIEDNLIYIPFAKELVLVTNPEPTAHVSAGGYIKNLFEYNINKDINIWHNKCFSNKNIEFSPFDVVGNYNKNIETEAQLSNKEMSKVKNLAYIPKDPSLDLIQGNPSAKINLLYNIKNMLTLLLEKYMDNLINLKLINKKTASLISYYLVKNPEIKNTEKYLQELGTYIKSTLFNKILKAKAFNEVSEKLNSLKIFSEEESLLISNNLEKIKKDKLLKQILKNLKLIERSINEAEKSKGIFSTKAETISSKGIDREIASLLMMISKSKNRIINMDASVLLFYYSLFKLYQSETIVDFTNSFIPSKKDSQGNNVRDRNKLISYIIQKDNSYKKNYFNLIKTIYPIVNKQLSNVIQTFELQNLVLKNKKGINKEAYLKLLSNFVHDSLFSGLSIIVGFEYRRAAIEFQNSAEKLLKQMTLKK